MSLPSAQRGTDLSALFEVATQALAANQSSLNQADTENQNHGDNLVQAFNMIARSMANQRGSGQVYAKGLSQAAQQLQGQEAVTPDNAMLLIQSLLGGGQQPSSQAGCDLLGTLLGGQHAQSSGGGLSDGIDMGDLLNAGMTFMNAKQQGQDNMQAALSAFMSPGPMAQKPHRQQSGQLVANALLQAIAGMSHRR